MCAVHTCADYMVNVLRKPRFKTIKAFHIFIFRTLKTKTAFETEMRKQAYNYPAKQYPVGPNGME